MAYRAENTLITNREMLVELLTRIGSVLSAPFMTLADNSANMNAVDRLNAKTDAELAEMGLTRSQAAQMMFRHDA